MTPIIKLISQKCSISEKYVANILALIDEGSTIPFIARYRKEMTGGATDEQLRSLEEAYIYGKKLLTRKGEVERLIDEKGRLDDSLRALISAATTLNELEDIYRPFKEKKNSRAALAIAAGLEPLADILLSARLERSELEKEATKYLSEAIKTAHEAISGAKDIAAERYSDDPKEHEYQRRELLRGSFEIKAAKGLNADGLYAKLADKGERISTIPSHRYLAVMRGVEEK